MSEELKACPVCGSQNVNIMHCYDDEGCDMYEPWCKYCGFDMGYYYDYNEAKENWDKIPRGFEKEE